MDIILGIILGTFFGLALYIAGASNPDKLKAMLRLEYLTLMKIIVFAIGFASILLSIANLLGFFNVDHFNIKSTNLGVIVGGIIFGLGFGWAGTCPGTCVAATTGKGFKKAIVAVIGGLLGAFVFSIQYGWWKNIGLFEIMKLDKVTLFSISDKYNYIFPGSFIGLLVVGAVMMLGSLLIPNDKSC